MTIQCFLHFYDFFLHVETGNFDFEHFLRAFSQVMVDWFVVALYMLACCDII